VFLNTEYIALGAAALLVISISGWMGSQVVLRQGSAAVGDYTWERAAGLIGCIALIAYLIFFKDFVFNPLLLFKTLTGAYRPDRTNLQLTAGVTSFDNFGPVFFSIYGYLVVCQGVPVSRRTHGLCAVLLAFTALRVYAWSERLALIEAAVPFGLAGAARFNRSRSELVRWMARGGLYLALPVVIVYFGVAEYFRSWQSSTYQGKSGFWEFSIGRLASYYYSSLNNGAGILATSNWPDYRFAYTLEWLHKAPFVRGLFSAYLDLHTKGTGQFLSKFGDPEFNNPSGIYSVIFDLGLPLGTVYFALLGFAGGIAFRAYRANSFTGIMCYPILLLTFFEIFRYPYLGSPRGFTWVLGIAVAFLAAKPRLQRTSPLGVRIA